ncbi:MAG TPA: PhzF family phenazine biosynthesis protein [Burkholderiales bacterium]|nr:PhzF family phenazine biosynthesis protein [Burkholderiales bacterium]
MQVRFKQVDVFTRDPFRGNPVAVVLETGGLEAQDMQRIAAWTNLSETTFVLPPRSPEADYRLRIFTPRAELPFAGHPTIGSAHAVLEAGIANPKAGRLRQECGAGIIELEADAEMLWLNAPPAKNVPVGEADIGSLEKALGARVAGAPIAINVGPVWVVADMGSADEVDRLMPDMARVSHFTDSIGATGITVFGAIAKGNAAIHVRSFAPAHGIAEDPVCGSGNISVAAYLLKSGQGARFGSRYVARQGMQLGRDGQVSIRFDGGKILLGGSAVTCVEGTLRLP